MAIPPYDDTYRAHIYIYSAIKNITVVASIKTDKRRDRQIDRQTERNTGRQADTHIQADKQTDRQERDRQTERQTDRHKSRQTGRQTEMDGVIGKKGTKNARYTNKEGGARHIHRGQIGNCIDGGLS